MVEGKELEKAEKYLEIPRKPTLYGLCDEGFLELGKDPVPLMTVANVLKTIGRNPITHEN